MTTFLSLFFSNQFMSSISRQRVADVSKGTVETTNLADRRYLKVRSEGLIGLSSKESSGRGDKGEDRLSQEALVLISP